MRAAPANRGHFGREHRREGARPKPRTHATPRLVQQQCFAPNPRCLAHPSSVSPLLYPPTNSQSQISYPAPQYSMQQRSLLLALNPFGPTPTRFCCFVLLLLYLIYMCTYVYQVFCIVMMCVAACLFGLILGELQAREGGGGGTDRRTKRQKER